MGPESLPEGTCITSWICVELSLNPPLEADHTASGHGAAVWTLRLEFGCVGWGGHPCGSQAPLQSGTEWSLEERVWEGDGGEVGSHALSCRNSKFVPGLAVIIKYIYQGRSEEHT